MLGAHFVSGSTAAGFGARMSDRLLYARHPMRGSFAWHTRFRQSSAAGQPRAPPVHVITLQGTEAAEALHGADAGAVRRLGRRAGPAAVEGPQPRRHELPGA